MELRTASVFIDHMIINTHFFHKSQVEFDIDPQQIMCAIDMEKIIDFMQSISSILHKETVLTGENQVEFPLIKMDAAKRTLSFLGEEESSNFL